MPDNEYIDAWRKWKDENPGAYAAAAVLPVTGQIAAVADFAEAMDRDDSVDGAIAAASFIPGVKLAKYGGKIAPASLRLKSKMNPVERAIAPATKRADKIGATADAEQIGETVGKEVSKSQEQARKEDSEGREYMAAWGSAG